MVVLDVDLVAMLQKIAAAPDAFSQPAASIDHPKLYKKDEIHIQVAEHEPQVLLELLNTLLAKRFPQLSPVHLFRDLTYPLKKGVGNAFKWGNRQDTAKWITVSAVINRVGAVISVADEGNGFDYHAVWERYQDKEAYFTYGGSGFDQFNKAHSWITYVDGGRKMLLCFVYQADPGEPLTAEQVAAYGAAGDAEAMHRFLAEQPYFAGRKPLSCALFSPTEPKSEEPLLACVVACADGEVTLLGRFLPETAVLNEFTIATQLAPQVEGAGLSLPVPVAYLPSPPLALFAFRPVQNLHDFAKKKGEAEMRPVYAKVAEGLRRWHGGRVEGTAVCNIQTILTAEASTHSHILATLAEMGSTAQLTHAENLLATLIATSHTVPPLFAPIHNNFGWKSVLYDGNQFYPYFFENGCSGHPGFDVGNFLADLCRFYEDDWQAFEASASFFLDHYFASAPTVWRVDLPFFVLYGLLGRLGTLLKRPLDKWQPKIDALLTQCEQLLATSWP